MSSTDGSREANTALVLQFLRVIDAKQFDEAAALMTPDVHLHFSGLHFDRAGTLEVMRSSYAAFDDLRHDVEEIIAADDRVVIRTTLRGTHTGPYEGLAPTGRTIEAGQIVIFRVQDGCIADICEEVDGMVVMQQLGALPPPL